MPRRKPTSTTAKKEAQKQKRAIKRGDIPEPPPKTVTRHKRPGHPSRPPREADGRLPLPNADAAAAARRLESRFLKPSPSFLALSSQIASTRILPRPLSPSVALLPDELIEPKGAEELTCPRRPKWRYDMSKKEVERNEEGWFAKWRDGVDSRLREWREEGKQEEGELPRSPSYYERNLEVWRQLWRVSELSQIILILLDARCPPLHYPPSLRTYLRALRPSRPIILVLTKVDIVGTPRALAWAAWLCAKYASDGVRVVAVESYKKREGERMGAREKWDPFLPGEFRAELVRALREAHEELVRPPEDEEKAKRWRPRVKEVVDWEAVEKGVPGEHVGTHETHERDAEEAHPPPKSDEGGVNSDGDEDCAPTYDAPPDYLTIGLIGQPNVGKSSLLNALFGRTRVRASRTPGKTKHFQTLFLSRDIRLVDCPGLVMPSFVPMEMQVLAGTLPISQIPSLPSCVSLALSLLPLERILHLSPPASVREQMEVDRKRTWRAGMGREEGEGEGEGKVERGWTAMEVLEAYAERKGYVTAKAGRPDVMRAGNAILRALAEARIPWGFAPPGSELHDTSGRGIWLGSGEGVLDEKTDESEEEGSEDEEGEHSETDEVTEEEDESEGEELAVGGGLFAALAEADGTDEEEQEDDESR